jgi:hypothetical protein
MLAKAPEHRFASARELEARLATLLQHTVARVEHAVTAPVRPSAPPRPQPEVVRPTQSAAPTPAVIPGSAPEPPTPAPVLALREGRSPAFVAGVFFVVALLVGLASAGAVIVLRRVLGAA